ncbi:hypothetical protein Ctob_005494 [Chrysochromulina tobinii]|uniref:Uncharacterized protein n=1 Tax=Chrysochromulina tobinii TaxID=1460289 RepID=A0A0M0JYE1_9EUKA|nr:hypothetical protein Ctob_005494 [Chrysochromulina tobinii]|eukprot:KOO31332.1 hypothetical protein Ctob_005494 [Chrysochromulina sp. CCMP291]
MAASVARLHDERVLARGARRRGLEMALKTGVMPPPTRAYSGSGPRADRSAPSRASSSAAEYAAALDDENDAPRAARAAALDDENDAPRARGAAASGPSVGSAALFGAGEGIRAECGAQTTRRVEREPGYTAFRASSPPPRAPSSRASPRTSPSHMSPSRRRSVRRVTFNEGISFHSRPRAGKGAATSAPPPPSSEMGAEMGAVASLDDGGPVSGLGAGPALGGPCEAR